MHTASKGVLFQFFRSIIQIVEHFSPWLMRNRMVHGSTEFLTEDGISELGGGPHKQWITIFDIVNRNLKERLLNQQRIEKNC